MTNIAPLDRVIRHVNKDAERNGRAEKIVCIDAQTRAILDPPPLLGFLRDRRYYLVANSDDPRNAAHSQLNGYALHNLDYQLPMSVAYTVACRAGNEARAVLALFDPVRSLYEMFESYLTRWLADVGQPDIPSFVKRSLDDRASIEKEISARALADTGLDVSLRISLDWEMTLSTIHVNRDHLRALVKDFQDEAQDLNIQIALEVDPQRKCEAILYHRHQQKLHELVPREVLSFFRSDVTMQMFATELGSAALRQRLAEHLDRAVAPYGRRVGPIKLSAKAGPPEQFFEGEHAVTCRLHEFPKPVDVRCRVQMIRRNEALYLAAKAPSLQGWLKDTLERSVRQILFDARYIDVLTRFPRYEKAIRSSLEREAAAIGYSIEQLITGPDLEPLRWVHPFPIEIETTDFATRLPNVKVKLQFVVTARIPNLDTGKIRKYLDRDQKVPNAMRDAIIWQARRVLHAIGPERFYMRFHFSDVPDEVPLEEALVNAIRTRLETDFDAEVFELVIKVAQTDIMERLRTLMGTFCPIMVELSSLHGRETLVFRGNFQVDAVAAEGWPRFELLTSGVDQMRKLLEEHLQAELSALTPKEMMYRDPRHRKKLELVFVALAERFMRDQFGVEIRITNVRRDATPHELAANQKLLGDDRRVIEVEADRRDQWANAEMLENHERTQRLALLHERKRKFMIEAGREEDIAEIDRQIEVEKNATRPSGIGTFDQVKDKVLPDNEAEATLLDVARLAGLDDLFTGPKKRLLDGDTE